MRATSLLLFLTFFCVRLSYGQTAAFTASDTVCVNAPVNITNTSSGASSYYWNFCVANINTPPVATNIPNPGGLSRPVYIDYVYEGGKYYGFVTNNLPGGLLRLDFGNSLLNIPVTTNLGNVGGVIPNSTEGLQIVKNQGKWYVLIVGGDVSGGTVPSLMRIDLGTNIANNTPTGTNFGNIGNLDYPHDLYVFEDNGNWYGLTINTYNNTVTRFNFTNDLANTPTAVNLGNIGNLSGPTGLHAIKENGNWYLFVTNATSHTLSRIDFGTSLLNTPTGVNLGNIGNTFDVCWDIFIMKFCGEYVAFVINGNNDRLIRLNFGANLLGLPIATDLGNLGNMSFPHCLSKIFRVGPDLYSLVANVDNNSITRFQFTGCTGSSIPNSTAQHPPAVTYNTPGIYNINLSIDEGLPTQTSYCKQVVVKADQPFDFSFKQDPCNPLQLQFTGTGASLPGPYWNFGDGNVNTASTSPFNTYPAFGDYLVKFAVQNNGCIDTVRKLISVNVIKDDEIITPDTTICYGAPKQLRTKPALSFCWSPTTWLNNPVLANPITSTPHNITYYFTSQTTGINLIANGDFSAGNTGFTSAYNFATPNVTEGQYFVGTSPQAWNASLSNCGDRTTGNGNMMLVNGSPTPDVGVWKQTITVTPNTNYAFSTWIQALWPPNPAQLSFSINGQDIGNLITASMPTCTWTRFFATWNSGNSTTATIAIVNKNTQVQGNDFALDDISFAQVITKRDSVVITVDSPRVVINKDTMICIQNRYCLQLRALPHIPGRLPAV